MMPAPQEVIHLVERFRRNLIDYRSGKYNETQVRLEFIDPFFEALGWDVRNTENDDEVYRLYGITEEEKRIIEESLK